MLMASAAPAQDRAVEQSVAAAAAVGRPEEAVPLSQEELASRVRSPVFRRGVFHRDGATVQPGLLVRALRRAAIDAGVLLYEGTPALRARDGEVSTPGGTIRAREVVLATNAALTGWSPAGRSLTNFGSYVVHTEPVP
jgi:glycine/D-amino acid oxidase-like deaminating enzyme